MIDLHLHTNMSDGSDSPLELLNKVEAAGLEAFSVTDHDDLRANAAIFAEINKKEYLPRFITGCEISSVFKGRNLHLLCYDFDPLSKYIKELISEGANFRRQRITAMFEHLITKHNIVIPSEDKEDILSREIPGKVHITDAALKLGIKMSRQQFFDTCLDDMESREFKIAAERVIDLVNKAGGVVSFAHPIEVQREYKINIYEIENMSKQLKDNGLTAIEVYHSLHGMEQIAQYKNIATKFDLFVSGGSDYHGKNKDVKIGQLNDFGFSPRNDDLTIINLF